MRIHWLVPDDYGSGVFTVAATACRQARRAGHDVTLVVLCPRRGGQGAGPDVSVVSLEVAPRAAEAPAVLLAWLRERAPEVLVLNGCEEADAVVPYLPNAIRCVYAVHDTARRYWQTAVRQERDLDAIVAVSEAVARNIRPHLVRAERLRVVPNGTEFPEESQTAGERAEDLIFAGGDNPMKGAGDVLRVWDRLQRIGFAGRLHWHGAVGTAFAKRLNRAAAADRIERHGFASREELLSRAGRCQVFLALTRAESFGMATLEAMGMGCVPVAWDIPTGTRELMEPGVHGLFVRLGDMEAAARAVMAAGREHARLGRAARSHARSQFTAERMGEDYERVFRALSRQPVPTRSLAGLAAPRFTPPRRLGAVLPGPIRRGLRAWLGRAPRLAFLVRDLRGLQIGP